MLTYVLIIWTSWREVQIPTTAEFATKEACTNALVTMTTQGFNGVCISKKTGRPE